MTALIQLLGGVRAAIFAGIAALLLVGLGIQTWRVDSRGDRVALLEAQALNWEQANRDNVKAIQDLRAANALWSAAAEKRSKAAADAVATVAAERDRLAAELSQRRKDRGKIYERDQDAAAWGRERVPDAVARQLRE